MPWPFSKKQEAPVVRKSRIPQSPRRRSFETAIIDRLTASWTGTDATINETLKSQLPILRRRARDISLNNDYGKRFISLVRTNVVGPHGIKLQSRVTKPRGAMDDGANRQIETAFAAWSKRGVCTVDGKLSFKGAQDLFVETLARDGEVLVRKHYGGNADNDFWFGLQFYDVSQLDHEYNLDFEDGRRIVMGVEMNRFGRPLAYHILPYDPGDKPGMFTRERERVPAGEIIHAFRSTRTGQVRGFPMLATAMGRLKQVDGYQEAELIAARVSSSKMGFFKSQDGEGDPLATDIQSDGTLISDAEPGVFEVLPEGYEFQEFDPQHPTTAYSDFIKTNLRAIASGLGVNYNSLANDLEGVNFSSLRQGALEDRDLWRDLQNFVIESFLMPVFEDWLKWALTAGMVGSLPLDRLAALNKPYFQPRGWAWVDPQKEIAAHKEAVDLGVKTRTEIAAEQGRDFDDVIQKLSEEKEKIDGAGLSALPETPTGGMPNVENQDG